MIDSPAAGRTTWSDGSCNSPDSTRATIAKTTSGCGNSTVIMPSALNVAPRSGTVPMIAPRPSAYSPGCGPYLSCGARAIQVNSRPSTSGLAWSTLRAPLVTKRPTSPYSPRPEFANGIAAGKRTPTNNDTNPPSPSASAATAATCTGTISSAIAALMTWSETSTAPEPLSTPGMSTDARRPRSSTPSMPSLPNVIRTVAESSFTTPRSSDSARPTSIHELDAPELTPVMRSRSSSGDPRLQLPGSTTVGVMPVACSPTPSHQWSVEVSISTPTPV